MGKTKGINRRRMGKRDDFVDVLVGYENRKNQIRRRANKKKDTLTIGDVAKDKFLKIKKVIKKDQEKEMNKGIEIGEIKINKPKKE